jgi:hypothetical protein
VKLVDLLIIGGIVGVGFMVLKGDGGSGFQIPGGVLDVVGSMGAFSDQPSSNPFSSDFNPFGTTPRVYSGMGGENIG